MMRHNTIPNYCATIGGEFTLDEVARRYLNETKEDVKYHKIFELQLAGSETRKKLATYCVQDALLPYSLLTRHVPDRKNPTWNVLEFYIRRSRETGIPLKYLVTKSLAYHVYFKRVRLVS